MTEKDFPAGKDFLERALDATIRIGVLLVLIAWCFTIVRPFILPIAWGVIIAVAAYPGYQWMLRRLGGRHGLAATLFTLLGMIVLVAPTILLADSVTQSTDAACIIRALDRYYESMRI